MIVLYQDFYQYLQWLQSYIQSQEQRIASLEKMVGSMRNELKQLREKQAIHVDRIEYKFDQLKVETLEGTLTIGLNPNDMAGIEDFAVQNQTLKTPLSPNAQMKRTIKIEEAIYQYLETELPQILEETQARLAIPTNESYLSFIKDDIIKQLPNRIDFHLKSFQQQNHSLDPNSVDKQIIELIKQEIRNGVSIFLSHLPDQVKGMKKE
ncbi:spore germination protein GerPC [Bacillus sp. FJAT-29814]|uniref:spore germination protein GerPC n=1 Tax=Bacillus sp. FJAT-29814 TaxID=1729688 RepID=UPI0020A3FC30|nr:spore germination protein GerPC [Bacillus sp. FJAT-29814]